MRQHRTEVIALLDEVIAQRPLAEWAERFDAEGVWWALAQSPAEVVEDPQLVANDGFVTVEGGAVQSVNGPVSFSDVAPDRRSASRCSGSTPPRCWAAEPISRWHRSGAVALGPSLTYSRSSADQAARRASRPRAMTRRWISLVPSPITMSGASR